MIKPFTEEERQASKDRDRANARPWTIKWRESSNAETYEEEEIKKA